MKKHNVHVGPTHPEGLADFESMALRFPLFLWEALQSQLIEELCLDIRKWLGQTHAFFKIH